MKMNWGTGMVLALVGFIAFIMFFVIKMNIDKKYEFDLVTEDYYEQELKVQGNMEKEQKGNSLTQNIRYKQTTEGILITFPDSLNVSEITGKVFLYRPSDKQFDFETPISLSDQNMLIPDSRLLGGRWNLIIDWEYDGNDYRFKREIRY
ncbi:cytochrome C oxidase Cbb3 [Bizionia argentinensis JUB59]|uniref:Cytochrome C oxidase Cbb3 n=1 Tax=Bizionia argentinensis JUB59 TaxID=1046627 RepID=G2EC68_9FLAO|nr:FixH family protein [Bizionia argentinensis]EGV43977.1 cytochrome C oxidase Cbb3 [Bizionia argentinensis JUB59]